MSEEANQTELIRRIENLLREGTVAAIDLPARRVRVSTGNLTTDWIRWFAYRAGDVRRWSPPFLGEQCMLFSPGGDTARAVAMPGLYSDAFPAPSDSGDVERTDYPDGAVIEYDHAAHKLTATLPAGNTAEITAPTSVTVHSQRIELDAPLTTATGALVVKGLFTFEAGMVGSGTAGEGGSTAQINGSNHRGFITIAFADALRREIAAAWRVDERMLTDRATKEWAIPALSVGMCSEPGFMSWCNEAGESLHTPRSARWVMQNYASWRRRFTPDYYAAIVGRWIHRMVGTGHTRIAVTDLRDPVEEALLRQLGAQVIRVHGTTSTRLADDTAHHSSERLPARITADADIQNHGSLLALTEAVLACPLVPQGRA